LLTSSDTTHGSGSLQYRHARSSVRWQTLLSLPRLDGWLAACALILSSPALWIGFYLDDYVGRYIYSQLPGAAQLFELYSGGYGLADGDPAHNHWQIEQGWAPWWTYDQLRIRLFRPLGILSHRLDFTYWPDSPWLMHLHSLLWLALLVIACTHLYRTVHLDPTTAGLAAVLFTFDHTHGFVSGYICNRHALITALPSVLALTLHIRASRHRSRGMLLAAYACYACALLCGESAVACAGYLFAYAVCAEPGSPRGRALRFAPYLVITLLWRALYTWAGFGGVGSGLYIDPAADPLGYARTLLERTPVLILGQFLAPPAELYALWPSAYARAMWWGACAFSLALLAGLTPLLGRDRTARFWALGAVISLIPAASAYPHNRQLLFTSFGAMGLLAQCWHLHAVSLRGQRISGITHFSRELGGVLYVSHILLSPLVLPLTSCGIAVTAPLSHAAAEVRDLVDLADQDVVFVTSPDYFAVKLVQLFQRLDHAPLPRRIRALSFGPEHVRVRRSAPDTLELDYAEGILSTPFSELYRDRRLPMQRGEHIDLQGLSINVLDITNDARARRVRFHFDTPLEAARLRFLVWRHGHYEPWSPPAVGQHTDLPPARLELGF